MAINFARILAGAASGYGKFLSDEAEEARKRALLDLERQFADAELLEQRADDDENFSGIAEEEAGNRIGAGPRGGLVPGAQFEPASREPEAVSIPDPQRVAFLGGDEDAAGALQGAQDFSTPPELSTPIETPIPEATLAPRPLRTDGAGFQTPGRPGRGEPELAPDDGRLPGEAQSGGTGAQVLADGGIAVPPELRELGQGKRVRDDDSGTIYMRHGDRLMPVVPDSAPLPGSAPLSDAGAGPLVAGQQLASAAPDVNRVGANAGAAPPPPEFVSQRFSQPSGSGALLGGGRAENADQSLPNPREPGRARSEIQGPAEILKLAETITDEGAPRSPLEAALRGRYRSASQIKQAYVGGHLGEQQARAALLRHFPNVAADSASADAYLNSISRGANALGSFAHGAASVATNLPKTLSAIDAQLEEVPYRDQMRAIEHIKAGTLPPGGREQMRKLDRVNYRRKTQSQRAEYDVWAAKQKPPKPPQERALYRAGAAAQEAVEGALPVNPAYEDEFWASQFPRGFGELTGMIALGRLGKAGRISPKLVVSTAGSAAQAANAFEDAIESGASLEDAYKAANWGALIGTSEAVPVAQIVSKLDKVSNGSIKRIILSALLDGTEGAAQNAFQKIASNLVAGPTGLNYDPERGIFSGTVDGTAVGFSTETLASLLGGLAGGS